MSVKLQARLVAYKTCSPTYPSGNHPGALQRRRRLDDGSTTARRQLGVLEMIRTEMDESRQLSMIFSSVSGSRWREGGGRDRCAGREVRHGAECPGSGLSGGMHQTSAVGTRVRRCLCL
jgi:hypothetical protein